MVRAEPILGVVLAGGRSSRMGTDKAVVELDGLPLFEHVARALVAAGCDEVVVAGRAGWLGPYRAVADLGAEHLGPLAGLVTVLEIAAGRRVALVAVDQPWVRPETIGRLADRCGALAAVPVVEGVRQTTCAVYPAALAEVAREELEGGGSIQSVLDRASFEPVTDWAEWGEDGRSWFSVDTPGRLEEGLSRFGSPAQPPM